MLVFAATTPGIVDIAVFIVMILSCRLWKLFASLGRQQVLMFEARMCW